MGLGLRVCACGFDGFHGPGCLLRVWAILSHARGPCHLNRNNQLIGFPVLRCSEERPPPLRGNPGWTTISSCRNARSGGRPITQKPPPMSDIPTFRPLRAMQPGRGQIRPMQVMA